MIERGTCAGRNHPGWKEVTQEMIEDQKKLTMKQFKLKYDVSQGIWDKIRKGGY